MNYVMSDLHGCKKEFDAMLEKINFGKDDYLYIIGDIIDRGTEGMDILLEIMMEDNIFPILGNHELYAYKLLDDLYEIEVNGKNELQNLSFITELNYWMMDGGRETVEAFRKLDAEKKKMIIEYLREFRIWDYVEVNNTQYLLVHAGVSNYDPERPLTSYNPEELVYERLDYDDECFPELTIISGHTPTLLLQPDRPPKIFRHKNHIVMDCGVVFGGRLSCLCLETQEEFYVNNMHEIVLPDII